MAAPRDDLDVDTRFLLANERTLLAWSRTAMALIALGVGVQQFGDDLAARTFLAALLLVTGGAASIVGALRYRAAERAIRAGLLPPAGRAPTLLAVAVSVFAGALVVALLVDAAR